MRTEFHTNEQSYANLLPSREHAAVLAGLRVTPPVLALWPCAYFL